MSDAPVPGRVDSRLVAAPSQRPWPAVAALAGLVVLFALVAGLPGLGAGLLTALVWLRVGTPYAIAAATVLVVALVPDGLAPAPFAAVAAGLLGLALAPAGHSRAPARFAAATLLAAAALAGLAWVGVQTQPLWVAATVTLGALALAGYGLYRYELVALGLVDEPAPESAPTTDSTASDDS